MGNDDITHEILLSIRDEIRGTNQRVDETNQRIDRLDERLTGRIDSLDRRLTGTDIRLGTAIVAMEGTLNDIAHMLRTNLDLKSRVERVEADVAELKRNKN